METSAKPLLCCLCSFATLSETDLEIHIDINHSDIFRQEENLLIESKIDTEFAKEQLISPKDNEIKKRGRKSRQSLPTLTEVTAGVVKVPAKRGRKSKATGEVEKEMDPAASSSASSQKSGPMKLSSTKTTEAVYNNVLLSDLSKESDLKVQSLSDEDKKVDKNYEMFQNSQVHFSNNGSDTEFGYKMAIDILSTNDVKESADAMVKKSLRENEAKKRGRKSGQNLLTPTEADKVVKIPAKNSRRRKTTAVAERGTPVTDNSDSVANESNSESNEKDSSRRGQKRVSGENIDSSFEALRVKKSKASDLPHDDDQLTELLSRNSELELCLINLSVEKERLEKEKSDMKIEMIELQNKADSATKDFECVKDNMYKASKTISSKNAEISGLKLSEERLVLDNNKIYKEMTKMKESADAVVKKFEVLRTSLKKVQQFDDDFAENVKVDLKSLETDEEVCEIFNCIVGDYVKSKQSHLSEFQSYNEKLKVIQEERDALQASVLKLESQNVASSNLNMGQEESKRLGYEIVRYQKDIQNIAETMKLKDDQIRDLQYDLKLLKERSPESEHKHLQLISILRDEVRLKNRTIQDLQYSKGQPDLMMVRLQKEMETREKDYLNSLQKYSSGLEALKTQVKKTLKEKDDQISRLTKQLKSAEVMLRTAKQHLLQQKSELEALGGRSKLSEAVLNDSMKENNLERGLIKKEIQDAVPIENIAKDKSAVSTDVSIAPAKNIPESETEDVNLTQAGTLNEVVNGVSAQTEDSNDALPKATIQNINVAHAEGVSVAPAVVVNVALAEDMNAVPSEAVKAPAEDTSVASVETFGKDENVASGVAFPQAFTECVIFVQDEGSTEDENRCPELDKSGQLNCPSTGKISPVSTSQENFSLEERPPQSTTEDQTETDSNQDKYLASDSTPSLLQSLEVSEPPICGGDPLA